MVNIRLQSIMRKEFIQIIRDPRTLMLVILIPIMQLLMMGYAATTDVRNVPLAIFDQDRGMEARALLDAYRAADYFHLAYDVDSLDEILSLIDGGDAKAGLIIPPDYNQQIAGKGTAQIAFVLDGSDPTIAATSLSAAQLIAQAHATELMTERLARTGQGAAVLTPLEVRTQVWYNPDMLSAYFMVPGVIGMILYSITSILTATAVVRERERGTIEQLIVTPIRSWELIVGKILPYAVSPGAWFMAFWGAHSQRFGPGNAFIGALPAHRSGYWAAGINGRKHAAGGNAHYIHDTPPKYLPLWFLLPCGSDAARSAMDRCPDSA
jgi:ABC-2 type transport system permease protein